MLEHCRVFCRVNCQNRSSTPPPKTKISSVRRRRRGTLLAEDRYRLCQTPADDVPRESCPESGRVTVSRPAATTVGSTLRARPRNQRRRPGRLHPSADCHVRDSHVLWRRLRRRSAAPLLCCSARCFGDIYVLCMAFSVFPLSVTHR